MPEAKVITFRLAETLLSKLDSQAKSERKSRTDVITELIESASSNRVSILNKAELPEIEALYLILSTEGKLITLAYSMNLKQDMAKSALVSEIIDIDPHAIIVWFEPAPQNLLQFQK